MRNPISRLVQRLDRLGHKIRQRRAVPRTLPRLAYIGALGYQNLGDEAMFLAARDCYPAHSLLQLDLPQIERSLERLGLSGPAYFKGMILGGGTLISPNCLRMAVLSQQWNLPIWTLGSGAGSSGFEEDSQVELEGWRELLPQFRAVGLRGPLSLETVRALGCSHAEVIGDLALKLTVDAPAKPAATERFLVNIALPPDEVFTPQTHLWQQDVAEATALLVRKGWEPVGVAMHPRDVAPLEQLLQHTTGRKISILRPETAEEFFRIAISCRLAITVRLHAAVLSCAVGVPPLMVGYRKKCLDFMAAMDMEAWYVDQSQRVPGEIVARTEELALCCLERRTTTLTAARDYRSKIENYVKTSTR